MFSSPSNNFALFARAMKQRQLMHEMQLSLIVKVILGIMIVNTSDNQENKDSLKKVLGIDSRNNLKFSIEKLEETQMKTIFDTLSNTLDGIIKLDVDKFSHADFDDLHSLLKPKKLFKHLIEKCNEMSEQPLSTKQQQELEGVKDFLILSASSKQDEIQDSLDKFFKQVDAYEIKKDVFKILSEYLMTGYQVACKIYKDVSEEVKSCDNEPNALGISSP